MKLRRTKFAVSSAVVITLLVVFFYFNPTLLTNLFSISVSQVNVMLGIAETVSIWILIYVELYPRFYSPKLTLNLKIWKAKLPEFGIRSHKSPSQKVDGLVLIAEVQNSLNSKENASNCRAKLRIEEVTLGNEYIPWRYLQVATGRGSSWEQYHNINILKGDSGLLFICWSEKGENEGYLQTSSPQVQWNPYRLKFGKEYQATLTVIGNFEPSIWTFSFKIDSWESIEFATPKKA